MKGKVKDEVNETTNNNDYKTDKQKSENVEDNCKKNEESNTKDAHKRNNQDSKNSNEGNSLLICTRKRYVTSAACFVIFVAMVIIGTALATYYGLVYPRRRFKEYVVYFRDNVSVLEEEIQLDAHRQIEVFHSPSHNGTPEFYFMLDYKIGLSAMKFGDDTTCFLRNLTLAEVHTGRNLSLVDDTLAQSQGALTTPTAAFDVVYTAENVTVGEDDLGDQLSDFCSQRDIMMLQPQLVYTEDLFSVSRHRRQAYGGPPGYPPPLPPPSGNNAPPQGVYGQYYPPPPPKPIPQGYSGYYHPGAAPPSYGSPAGSYPGAGYPRPSGGYGATAAGQGNTNGAKGGVAEGITGAVLTKAQQEALFKDDENIQVLWQRCWKHWKYQRKEACILQLHAYCVNHNAPRHISCTQWGIQKIKECLVIVNYLEKFGCQRLVKYLGINGEFANYAGAGNYGNYGNYAGAQGAQYGAGGTQYGSAYGGYGRGTAAAAAAAAAAATASDPAGKYGSSGSYSGPAAYYNAPGYYGKSGVYGYNGNSGTNSNYGALGNSGNYGSLGNSGYYGNSGNSGYYNNLGGNGYYSASDASNKYGSPSGQGNYGATSYQGNYGSSPGQGYSNYGTQGTYGTSGNEGYYGTAGGYDATKSQGLGKYGAQGYSRPSGLLGYRPRNQQDSDYRASAARYTGYGALPATGGAPPKSAAAPLPKMSSRPDLSDEEYFGRK
ncbi:uncharacterized protein LOC106180024 [Lingula anatina]|uniref:Uncharacterized protein LOC106180024 n=1 Tax=Lingula anatina TaxID=7574 RepID=A0A1S3KA60_LINAN|nr:uncharacterized protein LOC106180024 [Lingula anatina]XP_013419340.1 uncharacterized protein LOC106180024 [Lingula anatina]|eukprot:XP_013419339.1 uncharacterized protein LOC106180024 [Lingula anatina]